MTTNVLTKALGGVQDLLFGIGQATQTRDGASVNIDRIQMIKPLATLADLQALDVTDVNNFYPYAETMGGTIIGDGHGGKWWFNAAEPIASDNGSTIVAGNGATVGCWILDSPITGTFTPYLSDASGSDSEGQTYSQQVGNYTKIGQRVFLDIYIGLSGLGTLAPSDPANIRGLPFVSNFVNFSSFTVGLGISLNLPVAGQNLSGYMGGSIDTIRLVKWDSTTGTTNLQISEVTASGFISIQGSYLVP